jgi:hypothetical protein
MLLAISWRVQLVVACSCLISAIAAFALHPRDEHANWTLPCCLGILALLWSVSSCFTLRAKSPLLVGRLDAGASLILLGGLILSLELTIRLLAAGSFGGSPWSFDFGLKCTADSNVSATAACERNIAFTASFNTFGHCVQGCLALLLLPAIERCAVFTGAPNLPRVACCFVAIYPVYNVTKRAARGASGFAVSSFANNGAEWAMGFLLGLSAGVAGVAVAAAARRLHAQHVPHVVRADGPNQTAAALDRPRLDAGVRALRVLTGLLLCLVGLLSAVLFGISWRNTSVSEAGADATDVIALVLMLTAPLCLAGIWCVCSRESTRAERARAAKAQQDWPRPEL